MPDSRCEVAARIGSALAGSGLAVADVVLVHSDTSRVARWLGGDLEAALPVIVDDLLERLGPSGTLVVPIFIYRFCRGAPSDR